MATKEQNKNLKIYKKAEKWANANGLDMHTVWTDIFKQKLSGMNSARYGISSNAGLKLMAYMYDNETI